VQKKTFLTNLKNTSRCFPVAAELLVFKLRLLCRFFTLHKSVYTCDEEEIMTKQARDNPQLYVGFVCYVVSRGIQACVCQLMDGWCRGTEPQLQQPP